MKAMPLPLEEFEGKGYFPLQHHFSSSSSSSDSPLSAVVLPKPWAKDSPAGNCYVGCEPTSVLDARRSPSPPTSSSTLSSSLNNTVASALECGAGGAMDEWDTVLTPSHADHSILRLIMADADDPFHAPQSDFGLIDHHYLPPLPQIHHHSHVAASPPPKRLNTGSYYSFADQHQHQLQLQQQQQGNGDELAGMIAEQLSKAAELIETGGNPVHAQGILARLNHQLTPLGTSPLHRASFYFKEALQGLLSDGSGETTTTSSSLSSPFALILRIGAHKAFSDVSPLLQFSNFTSNQAILDATEGHSAIHVVDFDMSYGAQWASLMQELALRNSARGPAISLKITALAASPALDEFDLAFTHQNLKHFAADLNLPFHLDVIPLHHALASSAAWPPSPGEAVAVNLPLSAFASAATAPLLPLALRFANHLSPKIMVAAERGGDRPDAPFPAQVAHGLAAYSALLESLDAVNAGPDAAQKIERCLVQPAIERLVLARHRAPPWRTLVSGAGFTPASFSNFAESQAECLVQRSPARGFHVEKRHSSLVLCWQRKDLLSLSAWRC